MESNSQSQQQTEQALINEQKQEQNKEEQKAQTKPSYHWLMSEKAVEELCEYTKSVVEGKTLLHQKLKAKLGDQVVLSLDLESILKVLNAVVNTKDKIVWSERKKHCDDFEEFPVKILENIAFYADDVTFYNDGKYINRIDHNEPLNGNLCLINGPRLGQTIGNIMIKGPDFDDLTKQVNEKTDGAWESEGNYYIIDQEKYNKKILSLLLPFFIRTNDKHRNEGKQGIIQLSSIGCGYFAGMFKDTIKGNYDKAIKHMLDNHNFSNISIVHTQHEDEKHKHTTTKFGNTFYNYYPYLGGMSNDLKNVINWLHLTDEEKSGLQSTIEKCESSTVLCGDALSAICNEGLAKTPSSLDSKNYEEMVFPSNEPAGVLGTNVLEKIYKPIVEQTCTKVMMTKNFGYNESAKCFLLDKRKPPFGYKNWEMSHNKLIKDYPCYLSTDNNVSALHGHELIPVRISIENHLKKYNKQLIPKEENKEEAKVQEQQQSKSFMDFISKKQEKSPERSKSRERRF